MKILIADDEKLICYSIESMLEEIGIDKNDITVAYNGKDFLTKLKLVKPDVALVDIKMPKLNGIDALKEAKSFNTRTIYYILTSFPEFEYAKQAIDIGVSGYLLKPVSLEELSNVVRECRDKKKKILKEKNNDYENKINALFNGTISIEDKEFENLLQLKFIPVMFFFDSYEEEKKKIEYQVSFCASLREQLEPFLNLDILFAFTTIDNGTLVLLIASEDTVSSDLMNLVFKRIKGVIEKEENQNLSVTAITGNLCELKYLKGELDNLKHLSPARIVIGTGKIISISQFSNLESKREYIEISAEIERLLDYFNENQLIGFKSQLEKLEGLLIDKDHSEMLRNISRYIHYALNPDIRETSLTSELIEGLNRLTDTFIKERKARNGLANGMIIEKVRAYVEKNYMENIWLAQIAYYLGVTPNYLSAVFHKKTGKTFMSYITEIRLKKAVELLSEDNLKVKEIARQVGYYSPRYFSKIFRKRFGYYPSQLRKKIK